MTNQPNSNTDKSKDIKNGKDLKNSPHLDKVKSLGTAIAGSAAGVALSVLAIGNTQDIKDINQQVKDISEPVKTAMEYKDKTERDFQVTMAVNNVKDTFKMKTRNDTKNYLKVAGENSDAEKNLKEVVEDANSRMEELKPDIDAKNNMTNAAMAVGGIAGAIAGAKGGKKASDILSKYGIKIKPESVPKPEEKKEEPIEQAIPDEILNEFKSIEAESEVSQVKITEPEPEVVATRKKEHKSNSTLTNIGIAGASILLGVGVPKLYNHITQAPQANANPNQTEHVSTDKKVKSPNSFEAKYIKSDKPASELRKEAKDKFTELYTVDDLREIKTWEDAKVEAQQEYDKKMRESMDPNSTNTAFPDTWKGTMEKQIERANENIARINQNIDNKKIDFDNPKELNSESYKDQVKVIQDTIKYGTDLDAATIANLQKFISDNEQKANEAVPEAQKQSTTEKAPVAAESKTETPLSKTPEVVVATPKTEAVQDSKEAFEAKKAKIDAFAKESGLDSQMRSYTKKLANDMLTHMSATLAKKGATMTPEETSVLTAKINSWKYIQSKISDSTIFIPVADSAMPTFLKAATGNPESLLLKVNNKTLDLATISNHRTENGTIAQFAIDNKLSGLMSNLNKLNSMK